MSRALIFAVAALPALGACSSSKGSEAVNCSDVVLTPAGPSPKACVHEVPNGATVSEREDGSSVVTLNGRVVATYPPCPCPGGNTCMDRNGVAHSRDLPWSDGCQTCSCGDVGDGTLTAVCSHNTCAPDASADSSVDATDSAINSCGGPIPADAGVTSLDDLPVQSLCAASPGRLIQWTTACSGSIVVIRGEGVDCASYWLFDAATRALQATAHGCNGGPRCTGASIGFQFPSQCFDGNFATGVINLCQQSDPDGGHG